MYSLISLCRLTEVETNCLMDSESIPFAGGPRQYFSRSEVEEMMQLLHKIRAANEVRP